MNEYDDTDEEMYSVTSSKTIYRRTRSRPSYEIVYRSDTDEGSSTASATYFPVTKWAVDYNNKNYVRSKCNKNKGFHRKIRSRALDWNVEYDNNYHLRSKINSPKGLHRKIPDVKRKYVPDDDDLADATGWEFDYGPEYDQLEQDVTYIPEGRIVARGCYRWYGVKRNDSDDDLKMEPKRENLLNKELEEELKYGPEFLQGDRPHMTEKLGRRYSKGGYRFYEAARNAYDIKPKDFSSIEHDPEWRRKHHTNGFRYLELEMCDLDEEDEEFRKRYRHIKGKPFRRTVLNKVYQLRRRDSEEKKFRHGTRLSLVPGEGEKTVYEGVPDRHYFGNRKPPSVRDAFKRPARSRYGGSEYDEQYRSEYIKQEELRPQYAEKMRKKAYDKRRQPRRLPYGEEYQESPRNQLSYRMKSMENRPRHLEEAIIKYDTDDGSYVSNTWHENMEKYKTEYRNKTRRGREKSARKRERETKRSPRDEVTRQRNKEYMQGRSVHQKQLRKSSRKQKDREPKRDEYVSERRFDKQKSNRDDYKDKMYENVEYRSPRNKRIINDTYRLEKERKGMTVGRDDTSKKLPPRVQKRMKEIREKVGKSMEHLDNIARDKDRRINLKRSFEEIDLMKHKSHLKDRGQSHKEEYEEYKSKNGDEEWMKTEEKFTELHHKGA